MKKFNKIFQIGFNKCGTSSIHKFFKENGLSSIHWGKGRLAQIINANSKRGAPLLTNLDQFDCFTDMENMKRDIYIYLTHYKELDKQYPNSKFILNTRPVDKWLLSRSKHGNYLQIFKNMKNLTGAQALDFWKNQYETHAKNVKDYFAGRPEDLLIFDIETEGWKLSEFMSKIIDLKFYEFKQYNKTKEEQQEEI
jgi:hypothetical protein